MIRENFPLVEYFARIGLKEIPKVSAEGLQELHAAQAFSIPFENLDILLGRTLSLAPEDLIAKLIHQRRGGYCFELNGLLCLALQSLGFTVRPLLASVVYGLASPSAHTHEVLVVTIAGSEWLADVGFGGPGLCVPIPMIADQITEQYGESYRLTRDPEYGWILQKADKADSYINLYCFKEKERTLDVDIEMANHYTSTWPASIFRLQRMLALRKPWGRVTLSDMDLTIYRGGQSTRTVLPAGPEYLAAISEHFGIHLDARYEDLVSS
jgi:N-hydroxyarylamine O-acetyltransferase